MAEDSKTNLYNKSIRAFILMLILFIPVSIILFNAGRYYSHKNAGEQERMEMETLDHIVSHGDNMSLAGRERFDRNLSDEISLTLSFLREYVTEDGYTGPVLLENGFVARLDGDDVILPKGIPEGDIRISRSLIEESIESGALRTGRITEKDPSGEGISYYLSFAEISENQIFAAMTSEDEYERYLELYTADSLAALKNTAEISDGMIAVMSDNDGRLVVLNTYSSIGDTEEFSCTGLTDTETLRKDGNRNITVNGQPCRYIYTETDRSWISRDKAYVVQIFPRYSFQPQMVMQALMVCMLMFLIFMTLITYTLSEQNYVIENVMTKEQARRYNPARLRSKVISAGAVGAVSILFIAFLTHAVGQMHQYIQYGEDTLELMSGTLEQSIEEQKTNINEAQEQWYIHCGELIASFLEEDPEAITSEKLAEFCEILQADYLMLFDSKGIEYLSSNDYIDFTLNDLGDNSAEFLRLLKGIPSTVQKETRDSNAETAVQMIGVTAPARDAPGRHGVLAMALKPELTGIAGEILSNAGEEMALSLTNGTLCFSVNESTGEIINSSDLSMEGKTIQECGLSDESLQDGFMDFGIVNGVHCFIVTYRIRQRLFYYAVEFGSLLKVDLMFGLIAILLYGLALAVIVNYLMKGYTQDAYEKWAVVLLQGIPGVKKRGMTGAGQEEPAGAKEIIRSKAEYLDQKINEDYNWLQHFLNKYFRWNKRLPEEKTSLVFYICLFFIMQFWLGFMMVRSGDTSMFNYLLKGDWHRGINPFSICCILLFLAIANLIITISSWMLHLIAGFLGSKGETVCKLLRSIIKYISIFVAIFFSLDYAGVMNNTVIASIGVGSLALSLGAKDIVSDVLFGILIVFEQTLRIGDFVEYEGNYGCVREVGMRTTKLEILPGNDILEVRNSEIASVINKSKDVAFCIIDLTIHADEKLPVVEDILKKGLPEIAAGCSAVTGTPVYLGVTSLGRQWSSVPMITLSVGVNCDQKDYYDVRNYMNRELYTLLKEKGIGLY